MKKKLPLLIALLTPFISSCHIPETDYSIDKSNTVEVTKLGFIITDSLGNQADKKNMIGNNEYIMEINAEYYPFSDTEEEKSIDFLVTWYHDFYLSFDNIYMEDISDVTSSYNKELYEQEDENENKKTGYSNLFTITSLVPQKAKETTSLDIKLHFTPVFDKTATENKAIVRFGLCPIPSEGYDFEIYNGDGFSDTCYIYASE